MCVCVCVFVLVVAYQSLCTYACLRGISMLHRWLRRTCSVYRTRHTHARTQHAPDRYSSLNVRCVCDCEPFCVLCMNRRRRRCVRVIDALTRDRDRWCPANRSRRVRQCKSRRRRSSAAHSRLCNTYLLIYTRISLAHESLCAVSCPL